MELDMIQTTDKNRKAGNAFSVRKRDIFVAIAALQREGIVL